MTFDTTGLTEKRNRAGTKYYEDAQGEIVAKECTRCVEVKELLGFSVDNSRIAGRRARCKDCVADYFRKYREANSEEIKERNRKYREANPDYFRKYREANSEEIKERNRKYREANPDYYQDYFRKYYEANPDYFRKYYEANTDKIRDYFRKYYEANPDYFRKYYEANPETFRANNLRRRARKRLLPDTFTESDLTEVTLYFEGGCSLTGDTDVHMDHVLPLTAGHGGTTYENMIPLRDDLNISKYNHNIFEWFREEKERFGLSQQKFDELIEYLADINEMTTKEYRDFVRWCHDNPRTVEEIEADNERYGYMKPSSEIWREEVANKGRELVEA